MAIVEMLKLKLYGIASDKQKLLDCLFETQLVSLKSVDEIENTSVCFDEQKFAEIDQKRFKIEKAIDLIQSKIEELKPKAKIEKEIDVDLKDFKKIVHREKDVAKILDEVDELVNILNDIKKEKLNLDSQTAQLLPYLDVKEKFDDFKDTKHTQMFIGTLSQNSLKEFETFLRDCPLTTFEVGGAEGTVIKVYSHNSESFIVSKKLNELGFNRATFETDKTAKQLTGEYEKRLAELDRQEKEVSKQFLNFESVLPTLKTMHDYLKFMMAKENAENLFRSTKQAFVLEGYLAKPNKDRVEKYLKQSGCCIEYEFVEPSPSEMPPTITKNNKIVKQFEFVTDMYSSPHYRELDPNFFVALFFSLFFGFIMADIGYGISLVIFGLALALKQKRQTGFKKLMFVIAIGGAVSIVFGILFGSFFGLSHENWAGVPSAVLPNPVDNVITLLVACLAAGAVQIVVSFILKGILLIKRGKIAEAIFSAFAWCFFFLGLALFLLDYAGLVSGTKMVGIIITVASVATSVVGLFIINKGFERVSKSFGALYGIINLFSDVLSYARLFGLMLSGAIIATIVNQLASGFLTSPATFIAGAIVLLIGHGFNLSIGALGAYIHVARLQYIEFFSRFYEGEGELFVPFASDLTYVRFTPEVSSHNTVNAKDGKLQTVRESKRKKPVSEKLA